MDKVRFGIIGYGNMGIHAGYLLENKKRTAVLTAVGHNA